jgi:hypothetical protein
VQATPLRPLGCAKVGDDAIDQALPFHRSISACLSDVPPTAQQSDEEGQAIEANPALAFMFGEATSAHPKPLDRWTSVWVGNGKPGE